MKTTLRITILTLGVSTTLSAVAAAADRSYYVTELAIQQKFEAFFMAVITPSLNGSGPVVTGATAGRRTKHREHVFRADSQFH